jgi:hypothetical protein
MTRGIPAPEPGYELCLSCTVPGGCNERSPLCQLRQLPHWPYVPDGYVTLMQIVAETGIEYRRVWKYVRTHAARMGAHKAMSPPRSQPIWVVPRESADELGGMWKETNDGQI